MPSKKDLKETLLTVMSEDQYEYVIKFAHKLHDERPRGSIVMNSFCICGWHNQFSGNMHCYLIGALYNNIIDNY